MHASDKKRRAVRSFVRRAGRITQSQQRALDELWPVFGVSYTGRPVKFDEVFGTDQPVVAEIGFGNGETLVQLAAANPDQNFLGIDIALSYSLERGHIRQCSPEVGHKVCEEVPIPNLY